MTTPLRAKSAPELWAQAPGEKQSYAWQATWTDDGAPVELPLVIISGERAGPKVALVAGVHGDELEGQFALQSLAEELQPAKLAGNLLLVLCANPLAAAQGQRRTPHDNIDLNRVFPGQPE